VDDGHPSRAAWECEYHVVFTGKYRMKRIYGELRRELRDQFIRLYLQKGCQIEE